MNIPVREGETIEGSRTMRNRPYPVLKCSSRVSASERQASGPVPSVLSEAERVMFLEHLECSH